MKNNTNLPNLIIAGVTKGGSTSVFSYLADHPEVCASACKELCFFMNLRFDRPLPDIAEYKQYFGHCRNTHYRMEASPGYIYGGKKLAQGIKDTLGNPKILIILREPVKRFQSFFTSHQIKFIIDQDINFHEYLHRCKNLPPEGYKNPDNYPYFQLTNGCYSEYLPDWLDVFGQDLKVLFFEDLIHNNREFMRTICNWLEIDSSYYDQYDFVIENKTRDVKLRGLHKLAMHLNTRFEKTLRSHMRIKNFFRAVYYAFNEGEMRETSVTATEDMEYLQSYYRSYNEKLCVILRDAGYQDLPAWLIS